MALPHYNLNTSVEAQQLQQSAFPVILVPAEVPRKIFRVRQFLRSRRWLTLLGIIAVLAVAAMLWIVLDPNNKTNDPKQLLWPAVVFGSCCLFFLLALLAAREPKAESEVAEAEESPEIEVLPDPPQAALADTHTNPHIEIYFEQWTSEPFTEILDEAVLAEVFDDEMVAPDHMVFSVKVDE